MEWTGDAAQDLPVGGAKGQVASETRSVTLVGQDDILTTGDVLPCLKAVLSIWDHLVHKAFQLATFIII